MRVAYVIDSLEAGGAERSVVELAPALAARGVRLAVITRKVGGALVPAARDAGIGVVELGTTSRADTLSALLAVLGRHRPDVVHTATVEAGLVGRLAAARLGVPLLSTLTGTPYGPEHRHDPALESARVRAAQAVDALTAQLVWRFHAPARHVADVMAPRLGVPRARVSVIPRGRDLDALGERSAARRQRVRAALGVTDAAEVVLALARHEPVKGLDVLVEAATRMAADRPGLVVVVAGRDGSASAALRAGVAAAGLDSVVRLLGHRDDGADLLAAADVVAVPSRREGLPGTVIEAIGLGVPVVASDLPGCREVLGDDLGVLVPAGDPVALATALTAVLDDPSVAGTEDAARRRAAEHFGIAGVASETVALWVRTVAEGPPHGVARATTGAARVVGGSERNGPLGG